MDLFLQHIALLLTTCFFIRIHAYSNGQVTAVCDTMIPQHGASAQTSTSPYILSLAKTTYSPAEDIAVTLTSSSGTTQFKGFLIQARSGSDTTPRGSFKTSNTNAQTLTCSSAGSSVSHTSSSTKTSIQVTWVAPTSNITDIQIRATVVQSEMIFWTNVVSPKIVFASTPISTASSTTLNNSTLTTATSTSTVTATATSKSTATTTMKHQSNCGLHPTALNIEKLLLLIAIFVTFAL